MSPTPIGCVCRRLWRDGRSRCARCRKSFRDAGALLDHWAQKGVRREADSAC